MKLSYPLKPYSETQGFGANANPLYNGQGLKGHSGVDVQGLYGTPIYAVADCYLYSTINMGASPDRYRAIYTIVEDESFAYEVSYGHVIDCTAPVEAYIKRGTLIGHVGNFGDVYSGGHYVTKEEKIAGSTAGSHLHIQQRKCIRVPKRKSGKTYLKDSNGYLFLEGSYFEVVDPNNGYAGCVNIEFDGTYAIDATPTAPIPKPYEFNKPFGKSNVYSKDCDEMQQLFIFKGFMEPIPYNQRGFYGKKTCDAVLAFQIVSINLSWYEENILQGSKVGPKTIEALNKLG